jgi:hypothetical protein
MHAIGINYCLTVAAMAAAANEHPEKEEEREAIQRRREGMRRISTKNIWQ